MRLHRITAVGPLAAATLLLTLASRVGAEQVEQVRTVRCRGIVRAVEPGWLTVDAPDGRRARFKMQAPDSAGLALRDARLVVRFPCQVRVTGRIPPDRLTPGVSIRCLAEMDRGTRRCLSPVARLRIDDPRPPRIHWPSALRAQCEVVGEVVASAPGRLRLRTRSEGQAIVVDLSLSPTATAQIASSNPQWIGVGDRVHSLEAVRFSTGEWAVKRLEVELRDDAVRPVPRKLRDLQDPPVDPRQVRSRHFLLHTDLGPARAQRLLDSLEIISDELTRHFGRGSQQVIECYVVSDPARWSSRDFDPAGWEKINEGAGVTVTQRLGEQVKSVVYACSREDVVRHEAVHAFCAHTFGDTGPTWYAEGMAELGSYWHRPGLAVRVDPVVSDYLRASAPRRLADVTSEARAGDATWRDYAWRWAACQMLSANPNYSRRFADFGRQLMRGEIQSMDEFWGVDRRRAEFEYSQFIQHVGAGYRPDLCAWDWTAACRTLRPGERTKSVVAARRGWQPAGALLQRGRGYDYVANGRWKVDSVAPAVGANGLPLGEGRLCGAILDSQLRLGPCFLLGQRGSFAAPADGRLYVRCLDSWTQLADNEGSLNLHLRRRAAP